MNNAKLFSDEAANIYERAISTLLKKNMLLYFAYADYEEVNQNISLFSQTLMKSSSMFTDCNLHKNTVKLLCWSLWT